MAGNAAANMDDQAKAGEFFAKAVEANGMDNDGHFSTMYNLAIIQFSNEQYAESLKTMDRFLAESKSDKPEHLAFRAGVLANLDRHDEAAAIYKDLVAKNPNDKRLLMNAVAALQNGDKFDEANVLLESAYKRGMLTEKRELRALYIGYMNAQRWDDAKKVIDDGVAKGILQQDADLARDYQILAQNAYMDDKIPQAIELYKLAAPLAADGEAVPQPRQGAGLRGSQGGSEGRGQAGARERHQEAGRSQPHPRALRRTAQFLTYTTDKAWNKPGLLV